MSAEQGDMSHLDQFYLGGPVTPMSRAEEDEYAAWRADYHRRTTPVAEQGELDAEVVGFSRVLQRPLLGAGVAKYLHYEIAEQEGERVAWMCNKDGHGHIYKGRTDRTWPFDGQWCLCRKQRWSWARHKRKYHTPQPPLARDPEWPLPEQC